MKKIIFLLSILPATALYGADISSRALAFSDLPTELRLKILKKFRPVRVFAFMRMLSRSNQIQCSSPDFINGLAPYVAHDIRMKLERAMPEIKDDIASETLPELKNAIMHQVKNGSLIQIKKAHKIRLMRNQIYLLSGLLNQNFYNQAITHAVATMQMDYLEKLLTTGHALGMIGRIPADQEALNCSLASVIEHFISMKRSASYYRNKNRFLQLAFFERAGVPVPSFPEPDLTPLRKALRDAYRFFSDRQSTVYIAEMMLRANDNFDYKQEVAHLSRPVKWGLGCWYPCFKIADSQKSTRKTDLTKHLSNEIKEKFKNKVNLLNMCAMIDHFISAGAQPSKRHLEYMRRKSFLFNELRGMNRKGLIDFWYC